MKYLSLLFLLLIPLNVFGQDKVFGNKYRKLYWVGNCGEIYTIPNSGYVDFKDEKEAIEKGFKKDTVCTILEEPKQTTPRGYLFVGDRKSKTYFPLGCPNANKIPSTDAERFEDQAVAENKGYIQGTCGTETPKPEPGVKTKTKPKPQKTLKVYNILSLSTYTSGWLDQSIQLDGEVFFRNSSYATIKDLSSLADLFLQDESGLMRAYMKAGKAKEILKKAVVLNNGKPVSGTFTVILHRDEQERSEYLLAEIIGFRLNQ